MPIKAAVGNSLEVFMDGGIRSGQDVARALASGADGTLIGRAYIYGLGALGEAGVDQTLSLLRNELDLTLAFCGRTDIASVSGDILWP